MNISPPPPIIELATALIENPKLIHSAASLYIQLLPYTGVFSLVATLLNIAAKCLRVRVNKLTQKAAFYDVLAKGVSKITRA